MPKAEGFAVETKAIFFTALFVQKYRSLGSPLGWKIIPLCYF
jgi:hypothetical protein